MTCIVGIVYDGKVYKGGDSAASSDFSLDLRDDEKVFHKEEFIMGCTTSFRMGQLLRYKLNIPEHKSGIETYEYMITDFVAAVRTCLTDGGFASNESGGVFLIGYRGELFIIEGDYQVGKSLLGYDVLRSGDAIAKGSLFSTRNLNDPQARIIEALKASEQFSPFVRAPFVIKQV